MKKLCQRLINEINSKQDGEIEHLYLSKLDQLGIDKELMPNIPSVQKLTDMLKTILILGHENKYLRKVYDSASEIEFTDKEVSDLFDGLLNAWLFEEISKINAKDKKTYDKILKSVVKQKVWIKGIPKIFTTKTGLFSIVKHLTIEAGCVSYSKMPKIHAMFFTPTLLGVNILEAATQSLITRDGIAGVVLPLLFNPIIRVKPHESKTGYFMQNTKGWNDLYIIWNLAFITGLYSFNHLVFKLLFPNLLDYNVLDSKEFFIIERAASLHFATGIGILNDYDSPCNKELVKILKSVAKESAIEYTKENFDFNPSLYNKFVHKVTNFACK